MELNAPTKRFAALKVVSYVLRALQAYGTINPYSSGILSYQQMSYATFVDSAPRDTQRLTRTLIAVDTFSSRRPLFLLFDASSCSSRILLM